MYDFDAMEAVDDLIDEINEAYDEIFEELCERVESGELTLEEAEIINEAAADKYLEDKDVNDARTEEDKKGKKRISKKKIAAGVAAAGVLAAGAGAKAYANETMAQFDDYAWKRMNLQAGGEDKKTINAATRKAYKKATKLGKKLILDNEKNVRKGEKMLKKFYDEVDKRYNI